MKYKLSDDGKVLLKVDLDIETIDIPDSVITIHPWAFEYSNIKEVNAPNVTSIDDCAFFRCKNLISINAINLINIKSVAFGDCDKLKIVNIPKCETIGECAFQNCKYLEFINIPNCKKISNNAFAECDKLKYIGKQLSKQELIRIFCDIFNDDNRIEQYITDSRNYKLNNLLYEI